VSDIDTVVVERLKTLDPARSQVTAQAEDLTD